MKLRSLFLAIAAVTASGCMVGPDYFRPSVDSPESYRFQPKETAQVADGAWWKQYQDPVLDQLIGDSLAHNWSVQIAAANVEAAAGILTTTRAPIFPQVGYAGDSGRARATESGDGAVPAGTVNPQSFNQAGFVASWELDLWGRIRRQSEAAEADLMATEQVRRGVILTLVSSVANSYLQLRGLDEQLDVSKKTLETYSQSLKYFELQFKYGQVSQMTVAQAQSQYETAAAQIPLIEQQIVQIENALALLAGRNPGPTPRGKTLAQLSAPGVPAGLPSQLLERRPDLIQAEQQLIAANARIGAAKALYYPSISLTGGLGGASSELSDVFSGSGKTWNFTGSVTGPIFTAGLISGQVEQAEANQKAALFNYRQAIQAAFGDVSNALSARDKLAQQFASQSRQVMALRDYARLARLQYDGGYVPYSTVLQAEQQLFPAELTLAQTGANNAAAVANIYKAMGGGWVDKADQLTQPAAPAQPVANATPPVSTVQ
jgi:multidrug efflux system outer membrane protein